jgi:hypothetical protein
MRARLTSLFIVSGSILIVGCAAPGPVARFEIWSGGVGLETTDFAVTVP